jgi:YHS domain-containing protein
MKKLILVLVLLAGCATAYPPAVNVRDGKGYCAICRDWHDAAQMQWPVEYQGMSFRFCDPNCREAFLQNPEKYLKDPRFNPPSGSPEKKGAGP